MAPRGVRTMTVCCADWPVVATGHGPGEAVAVVHANRVVACSPAARREGVQQGHRRREAQARCPMLEVIERDESREARVFEPVVRAIEAFTPRLELTRPGRCAFGTRGPARYFGGDAALAQQVHDRVDAVLADLGWGGSCRVGVADGPFASQLAAQLAPRDGSGAGGPGVPVTLVPAGATPAFLAPLPIATLARDELTGVLERLGVRSLGALAALPARDVVARFGAEGRRAHRLASGLDEEPPDVRDPPPDLVVEVELDPPADRVDAVAFVAKALADELFAKLAARQLSCTRVAIMAETEHGESVERLWRHEGALTAAAVTDRVRWQLDGWLNGSAPGRRGTADRPTSGVTLLRLAPDEVGPGLGRQLGFWGGETEADARAARALARVQGLLGPDAVRVPEWRGGRGPAEQLRLVPSATVDLFARASAANEVPGAGPARGAAARPHEPWPGRVPAPAPALVHPQPLPAEVVDASGAAVVVNGRALPSASPARVSIAGGPWVEVAAWAGPWPVEERWWDPPAHRRRARVQVVVGAPTEAAAHLLCVEAGRWWVEASYD